MVSLLSKSITLHFIQNKMTKSETKVSRTEYLIYPVKTDAGPDLSYLYSCITEI